MKYENSMKLTLDDMRSMKETFLESGLSRRGTAALILTNKKTIETIDSSFRRFESEGGIKSLVDIWIQPFLIEFTNFWLNPNVSVTDKVVLTQARINVLTNLFRKDSHTTWHESVRKR